MNGLKKILYGVSDYAELRRSNGYFIDRTDFIRDLEAVRFAMFLRPRRFGKSLLVSILQAYYDVSYAERFEELFVGTKIGANPTKDHSKYLVLDFDFSAVEKDPKRVQYSFNRHACGRIDAFLDRYKSIITPAAAHEIRATDNCFQKLDAIRNLLVNTGIEIYVLIDEYDNFTNTILAESGFDAYDDITHGEGFFKQFFTNLKAATTGNDSPIKRIFITGVSPVTMDDVTSGFNIGTNITTHPAFANIVGFTHDELSEIVEYYAPVCGYDKQKILDTMIKWYDGYRFCLDSSEFLANTTMVLRYMANWLTAKQEIRDLVDANLRMDYAKIRHLVTVGNKLNGNFSSVENIARTNSVTSELVDSFQACEMALAKNFVSLMFYFGLLSIDGESFGQVDFSIPNETVRGFVASFISDGYRDVGKIDPQVDKLGRGLILLAKAGQWKDLTETLSGLVAKTFAIRDSVEGEKVVQATLIAYLSSVKSVYFVRHECEANGGYADLLLEPDLRRYPEVKHALLIELKYFNSSKKLGKATLATIRKSAAKQLTQYAADKALASRLNLTPVGDVKLTRLSMVFHGGKMVMADEV